MNLKKALPSQKTKNQTNILQNCASEYLSIIIFMPHATIQSFCTNETFIYLSLPIVSLTFQPEMEYWI